MSLYRLTATLCQQNDSIIKVYDVHNNLVATFPLVVVGLLSPGFFV